MPDVHASVKIEGEEMSDLLRRVEVEESDLAADLATLVFGDNDLVLSDVLHEGLSVEIDLGYTTEHAVLFRGIVTAVRSHFPRRRQPQVEIQAADKLILLSMKPKTKAWGNTMVGQIVRDVALDYGLVPGDVSVEEDVTIQQARPRQQVEETDLAFLHRLAREFDCKLFVEHPTGPDTINFVSTRSLLEADPIEATLDFNHNVEEFSASFEAFATGPRERLVTTDEATGERIELEEELVQSGETQWTPDAGRLARLGGAAARVSALLARSAAKRATLTDYWREPARDAGAPARSSSDRYGARGDRARRMGQTGRGRTAGCIWLRPCKRVRIEGYGGRWSGNWYLARVRHELDLERRAYLSEFLSTR